MRAGAHVNREELPGWLKPGRAVPGLEVWGGRARNRFRRGHELGWCLIVDERDTADSERAMRRAGGCLAVHVALAIVAAILRQVLHGRATRVPRYCERERGTEGQDGAEGDKDYPAG